MKVDTSALIWVSSSDWPVAGSMADSKWPARQQYDSVTECCDSTAQYRFVTVALVTLVTGTTSKLLVSADRTPATGPNRLALAVHSLPRVIELLL
jgi:hypothetical protein